MAAYYNEIEPYCVEWLKNLIAAGIIAPGEVDSRPIQQVTADDLKGFTQCHFFAGIGGWSYAARLAGWPDDRPLWTGSCPCQPFSVAGRRKGIKDERHLWPDFYRLIRIARPPVLMGEQVASAIGYAWFDGVAVDLEAESYSAQAVDIPACAVNAPERRNRIYWLAVAKGSGSRPGLCEEGEIENRNGFAGSSGPSRMAGGPSGGFGELRQSPGSNGFIDGSSKVDGISEPPGPRPSQRQNERCDSGEELPAPIGNSGTVDGIPEPASGSRNGYWDEWELIGPDPEGNYRRLKPGLAPLVTRLPGRIQQIRAYGNAINPEIAAEVIRAWMDVTE